MRKPLPLAGLALTGLLLATPAHAHKLKVFAAVDGDAISGYAYFFGGGRAVNSRVVVSQPNGQPVAELTTDAEGVFRFEVKQHVDYRISVDGGDGHIASVTVGATELPQRLVMPDGAEIALKPKDAETIAPPVPDHSIAPPDLATLVESAVAHQVRPLREQIDAANDRVWLHDVLGGLGYIIGMAGLAYGLMSRRRPR
jgi:nickel transport protein